MGSDKGGVIVSKIKFNDVLYLFKKTGDEISPVRKIELTEEQKEILLKHESIFMRDKTNQPKIFIPNANTTIASATKRDQYKSVIDVVKGKILILGIYKVDKKVNNGS